MNMSDDIIIFGKDIEEHDEALHAVMEKLKMHNLSVKRSKCQFYKTDIDFFGLRLTENGVAPQASKIEAIKNTPSPTSQAEVRSFLGMASYCSRFIPNFSTVCEPLRNLTKKHTKWSWSEQHEKAFRQIQTQMTQNTLNAYFDPNKCTEVSVDASPVGLAAILS